MHCLKMFYPVCPTRRPKKLVWRNQRPAITLHLYSSGTRSIYLCNNSQLISLSLLTKSDHHFSIPIKYDATLIIVRMRGHGQFSRNKFIGLSGGLVYLGTRRLQVSMKCSSTLLGTCEYKVKPRQLESPACM